MNAKVFPIDEKRIDRLIQGKHKEVILFAKETGKNKEFVVGSAFFGMEGVATAKGEREKQESASYTMKKRRKAKLGEVRHRWLVPAAGALFLIAGEAKLISVFGDAKILKLLDSVLRLPWWLLMAIAGR